MKELIYHRHLLPAVTHNADQTLVIDGNYQATYRQHFERVCRLCGALDKELDIGPTDRIAVMSLNSHYFLELYHASYLGAATINPLNLRLAATELEYILQDSGTEICFVDPFFAPLVDEVRNTVALRKVILLGEGDVPHDVKYDDLIENCDPVVPEEPEETDPVVLMYTGGTTGLPKGVLLNQRAEMLNVYHGMSVFPLDTDSVYLVQTPMFHAAAMYGILAVPMGAKAVIIPMFDPAEVTRIMVAQQVTTTVMVPTMIGMLLNHPEFTPEAFTHLRTLVYGASPMPLALLERLRSIAPDLELLQGYGMTESSSMLSVLTHKDHEESELLSSVGRPLPGVTLSIQDEEGNLLPLGATGEVCARAGNLMIEYWNKKEATQEAFRDDWYHTGDAGYVNDRGYLFLVDRVKDMIISGGENIYSIEVENAIASHEAVAQVAVIGIPDDMWGEAVHAVVVLHPDQPASEAALIDHARQSVAGYKVPKSVSFRTEPLPLSGALKVLKRDLRAPFWAGKDRGVN
jgi:acyl-CoA synthetase (AMP-forming)/AMP-acid ligase II